jgi:hypothetical protein
MRRLVWTVSLLGLLACEGGRAEESATASETGDGDGDSSGDGDGDPTGDGDGDSGDGDGDGDTGDGDGDGDGQCTQASDCAVINDCCNCGAAPADMVPPCMSDECLAPVCDGNFGPPYVPAAACMIGTCVLEQIGCDESVVTCEMAEPPPCVGGLVRSYINDCYGPCVLASMCTSLPTECDADTCGEGFVCMTTQSGAPSRCVPLPPACNGVGSCECIGPWLGEVCNGGCGDLGGTLLCEDGG